MKSKRRSRGRRKIRSGLQLQKGNKTMSPWKAPLVSRPTRLSLLSLLLCSLPVGLRPPLKHLYLADRPLTAEREERGHSRDLKHDLGTNQISE